MIHNLIAEARSKTLNSYPGSPQYDAAQALCLHLGINPYDPPGRSGMTPVQNIIYEALLMRLIAA